MATPSVSSDTVWEATRENFYWVLHDPVSHAHHTASLVIFFGLTGFVLKEMVAAYNARNLYTLPIVVLTPLGLGLILAGMSWAEVYWLPSARDLPSWLVLGVGGALTFFGAVVPVSAKILKGGYLGMASAWITTLAVTVVSLYAAALLYEGINPNVGKVVRHHGTVAFRSKPEAPWQALGRTRPALLVGSEVRTEEGSTVVLKLGRRNHLGLGQNSQVRIMGFGEKGALEMERGKIIGSVSQYEQATFQVRTDSAHVNVNQGLFMVTLDGMRNTIVTVAEGAADLSGTQAYSRTVTVAKGQASTCVVKGQPLNTRAAQANWLQDLEAFRTALANPYDPKRRDVTENF